MKFLLLLVPIVLATNPDLSGVTKTFTCADGKDAGYRNTLDECYCDCNNPAGDDCYTVAALASKLSTTNADAFSLRAQIQAHCAATTNPGLAHCPPDRLEWSSTDCVCPTCKVDDVCDDYANAASKYYQCNRDDNTCRVLTCTTSTDNNGNVFPQYTADLTVTVADDGSKCADICSTGTVATVAPDECSFDGIRAHDRCYCSCVRNANNGRMEWANCRDAATAAGDLDVLQRLVASCGYDVNAQLKDCDWANVVPNGYSYSKDNILAGSYSCDCPVCNEPKCEFAVRYETVDDGKVKYCKKITCTNTEIDVTLNSIGASYANRKRVIVETTVSDVMCGIGVVVTRPLPDPVTYKPCDRVCTDADPKICIYDSNDGTMRTFACAAALDCARNSATDATRYSVNNYGRCRKPTDDECTLGDVRISDRYAMGARGPKVCKCVANPDDSSAGNIEVCDTFDRMFDVLKAKCPTRLGADTCTRAQMYFNQFPSSDNMCDRLYCDPDPDRDASDPDTGSVCRLNSERFNDAKVAALTSAGCYYRECDKDDTSLTYGKLVSVRYDGMPRDVSRGLLDRCPHLLDCKAATFKVDRCGECPTCPDDASDDACDRNTLRTGDNRCDQDPRRLHPGRTIDRRLRFKEMKARVCVDRLVSFARDKLYGFLQQVGHSLAADCANLVRDSLEVAVNNFDYTLVDRISSDSCYNVADLLWNLDFTDTTPSRLDTLRKCLIAKGEDIRDAVRDKLKDAVRDSRIGADGTRPDDDEDDGTLFVAGSSTDAAAASAANVFVTDEDGGDWIVNTEEPDTDTDDDPSNTENAANRYVVVTTIVASFIAILV